jgi:hypothetical protein
LNNANVYLQLIGIIIIINIKSNIEENCQHSDITAPQVQHQ